MERPGGTTMEVTLRSRRQLTLPAEICETLGIEVGDRLEVTVVEDALVLKPKRLAALEALREIRHAFAASEVRVPPEL